MAARITKLFIIPFLFIITLILTTLVHCQVQVPCMFVFGDSLFDNGNNNNLTTRAKVNYFPYGIDFPGGIATGRFSNGKISPDFLAEFLGFDKFIPPFATANATDFFKGVNYASGASGILDDTGRNQGERISMNMQLRNHGSVVSKIALKLGSATLAEEHLKTCLYITHMGVNDYLNNYLRPQYFESSSLYTPQQYATLLIKHYSQQLTTLYNFGARKIAVFGPGSAGCVPAILSNNGPSYSSGINEMIDLYNNMLKPLVQTLNINLTNARFIYLNLTSMASFPNASLVGFRNVNGPCCISTSNLTGLCDADRFPCLNRREYEYWDKYHPTEYGNLLLAQRAYNSILPLDAYPYDIFHLVRQI